MRNAIFASAIFLAMPAAATEAPVSGRYLVDIDFTTSKTEPEAQSPEAPGLRQTRRITTSIVSS